MLYRISRDKFPLEFGIALSMGFITWCRSNSQPATESATTADPLLYTNDLGFIALNDQKPTGIAEDMIWQAFIARGHKLESLAR
ncbi:hypothetical protein RC77_05340 [Pectobacterium brasiliense]|nr:hypothetical protein RC77_05340 [Pectobacterium brasiliense]